ncbi:MAG: hypothetical protein AAGA02_00195 [Bacteroidota bacterium]
MIDFDQAFELAKCRIEEVHLSHFKKVGLNPVDFKFENQLQRLDDEYFKKRLSAERQGYRKVCPSDYELIFTLPYNLIAHNAISQAQELSQDQENKFRPSNFFIASESGTELTAIVETSLRHGNIIWIKTGLLRLIDILSYQFVLNRHLYWNNITSQEIKRQTFEKTLGLFRSLSFQLQLQNTLSESFHLDSYQGWINDSNTEISKHSLQSELHVVKSSVLTYILGHEVAHISLGHLSSDEIISFTPKEYISKTFEETADKHPDIYKEMNADYFGLICCWDGLTRQRSGEHFPVDATWVGFFLFLSVMAGQENRKGNGEEVWWNRVEITLMNMIISLKKADFELVRIKRILRSSALTFSIVFGASSQASILNCYDMYLKFEHMTNDFLNNFIIKS